MTVADLILALQAIKDKDMEVQAWDADGGFSLVYGCSVKSVNVDGLWETHVFLHTGD